MPLAAHGWYAASLLAHYRNTDYRGAAKPTVAFVDYGNTTDDLSDAVPRKAHSNIGRTPRPVTAVVVLRDHLPSDLPLLSAILLKWLLGLAVARTQ